MRLVALTLVRPVRIDASAMAVRFPGQPTRPAEVRDVPRSSSTRGAFSVRCGLDPAQVVPVQFFAQTTPLLALMSFVTLVCPTMIVRR